MKKIRTLLVDDEERARSVLRTLLDKSCHNINIVDEAYDVLSAIEKIKMSKPQLVFLDVEMPNYAGYEIVNFLDEIDFDTIFTTAYDQYAIKAFEICAVDYLLKPINRSKLVEAVSKVEAKLSEKHKLEQYQALLETIKEKKNDKIIIPELGNRRIIDVNNIIAIEANGAYTNIYLVSNTKITTSKNLKHFENKLSSHKDFFRSHRSWIINFNHLNRFNKTESLLLMNNNITAKITRSLYSKFEQHLNPSIA